MVVSKHSDKDEAKAKEQLKKLEKGKRQEERDAT
jgi:hypothetical protein